MLLNQTTVGQNSFIIVPETEKRNGQNLKRFFLYFLLTVVISINKPFLSSFASENAEKPLFRHVAIVCPEPLQASLDPWIQYRKKQGFVLHVLTAPLKAETVTGYSLPADIRWRIRELAGRVPLEFLILIGNGIPQQDSSFGWERVIPAARIPARVVQRFAEEDHLASDAWYGDLNDDGVPDLAVGRIPVETPEQLSAVLAKTIAYESEIESGRWQRRVNLVAGVGGFTRFIDKTIEHLVRNILTDMLPDEMEVSFTQANWKSVFCPYPPLFRDVVISRMNEGCLFWAYLGHGLNNQLDYVQVNDDFFEILKLSDADFVHCEKGPPLLFFFACYTGAFDSTEESLAVRFLRQQGGPVGILASSRMAMPYGLSVLGLEMLWEIGDVANETTIGEIVTRAKQRMSIAVAVKTESDKAESDKTESGKAESGKTISDKQKSEKKASGHSDRTAARDRIRTTLDETAKVFDPAGHELADQLADHIQMMNYFGDPLLKVRFPKKMELSSPEIAYATRKITVSGTVPEDKRRTSDVLPGPDSTGDSENEVLIELVLTRNRTAVRPPKRTEISYTRQMAEEFQETYFAANAFVIGHLRTPLSKGKYTATFTIPANAFGQYAIRVSCRSGGQYYTTARRLTVRSYDPTVPRPDAIFSEPE